MDGQAGPGQNARICMICWLASAERVQRRLEQQRNGNLVPNCGMRCRNGTQDFARTVGSGCLQGVVQYWWITYCRCLTELRSLDGGPI